MPTLDLQPIDVELKNGGQETPSVEGNVQPKESIVDFPRVKDVKYLIGKQSPTEIPSVEGNQGKYLKATESSVEWANVEALPDGTGHDGCFLKQGSSGPVWAEPVTGDNDGSYWTQLSVQTSAGLKTYAIPNGRFTHYASFDFADVTIRYVMDDQVWGGFVTNTIAMAGLLGYTGSDFEEAVAYIQTAWGGLSSEGKKLIAGKTEYGFLVCIYNGECLPSYLVLGIIPKEVFHKGVDIDTSSVTALNYWAYENNAWTVHDMLDDVASSAILTLTVGNI